MVSSGEKRARRKPPAERRAEIVAAAAAIAFSDGLERVTLRAVAERLGVRPGLITHYFPAVEELVAAAFALAVSEEREQLLPTGGSPLERIARLAARAQSESARELSRLWLNARHLARFSPLLGSCLEDQEALDRERLTAIIAEGVHEGVFGVEDAAAAAVRILIAVDGFGAYANNRGAFEDPAFTCFVADAAEWALGLEAGALRGVAREGTGG